MAALKGEAKYKLRRKKLLQLTMGKFSTEEEVVR